MIERLYTNDTKREWGCRITRDGMEIEAKEDFGVGVGGFDFEIPRSFDDFVALAQRFETQLTEEELEQIERWSSMLDLMFEIAPSRKQANIKLPTPELNQELMNRSFARTWRELSEPLIPDGIACDGVKAWCGNLGVFMTWEQWNALPGAE